MAGLGAVLLHWGILAGLAPITHRVLASRSGNYDAASSWSSVKRLVYVQAIWRHGDRAPKQKPYPADRYDEDYWPRGWSQLTNLGMLQMRELGEFFRYRYANRFVSASFNRNEVFLRSSDADRALVSAQALLNGFFPPQRTEDFFDERLAWQPIPVHSGDTKGRDPLLRPSNYKCATYAKMKEAAYEQLGAELLTKYADLVDYLRPIIHKQPDETLELRDITALNDINRELAHNLSQPEWVFRHWPQYSGKSTIDLIVEMRNQQRSAEFEKPPMYRLMAGYLLGDWLRRANDVAKGEKQVTPSRMMLYSSHDGTMQALLYALQASNDCRVPYAAVIIMELYQVENGSHVVELYYRRSGVLEMLVIRGCERSCPLERVVELIGSSAIYEEKELVQTCKEGDDDRLASSATRAESTIPVHASASSIHVLLALAFMRLAWSFSCSSGGVAGL